MSASEDGSSASAAPTEQVEVVWGKRLGSSASEGVLYEDVTVGGVHVKLFDCVEAFSETPEPYLARVVKLMHKEDETDEGLGKDQVQLLYFWRRKDVVSRRGKVPRGAEENEVFLAIPHSDSDVFAKSATECLERVISIVCIAVDSRNREPSLEERNSAKYVYKRVFNIKTRKFESSLDAAVRNYKAVKAIDAERAVFNSPTDDNTVAGRSFAAAGQPEAILLTPTEAPPAADAVAAPAADAVAVTAADAEAAPAADAVAAPAVDAEAAPAFDAVPAPTADAVAAASQVEAPAAPPASASYPSPEAPELHGLRPDPVGGGSPSLGADQGGRAAGSSTPGAPPAESAGRDEAGGARDAVLEAVRALPGGTGQATRRDAGGEPATGSAAAQGRQKQGGVARGPDRSSRPGTGVAGPRPEREKVQAVATPPKSRTSPSEKAKVEQPGRGKATAAPLEEDQGKKQEKAASKGPPAAPRDAANLVQPLPGHPSQAVGKAVGRNPDAAPAKKPRVEPGPDKEDASKAEAVGGAREGAAKAVGRGQEGSQLEKPSGSGAEQATRQEGVAKRGQEPSEKSRRLAAAALDWGEAGGAAGSGGRVGPPAPRAHRAEALPTLKGFRTGEQLPQFQPQPTLKWEEAVVPALREQRVLCIHGLEPGTRQDELKECLQEALPGLQQIRIQPWVLPLPPSSPAASVHAYALFGTKEQAKAAEQALEEKCLVLFPSARPLLGSLVSAPSLPLSRVTDLADVLPAAGERPLLLQSPGLGHMYWRRSTPNSRAEDLKDAIATSHCAQPNTVEFELGAEWRARQEQDKERCSILIELQSADVKSRQAGT